MNACQNNPEKSYAKKKKLSVRLLVIHCLQIVHFIQQKIRLIFTKVKTVWNGFCKDIREHAMKIINCEKKKWYNYRMNKISIMKFKKFEMQKRI